MIANFGYVSHSKREFVLGFINQLVVMFENVCHRWSSNGCFTGQTFIVLRSKITVSGLEQVRKKLFTKKPWLCLYVLSLLTFLFCFSVLCFSRVPRSGCWAGFMNPLRLCSKSHWLCCLTEPFLVFSLHKADSPSYLPANSTPGHLFSMLPAILTLFSISLV